MRIGELEVTIEELWRSLQFQQFDLIYSLCPIMQIFRKQLKASKERQSQMADANQNTFETWDFNGIDTCTETSASISSSSSCEIFEDEGNDFITSMDDDTAVESLLEEQIEKSVQVSVSGVIFSLKSSAFAKMHGLPWTWRKDTPQNGGFVGYSLETSPVLFELLLNHIMFGSLPILHDLSLVDAEELEPFAVLLRLEVLQKHLDRKLRPQSFGFLRRSSSGRLNDTSPGSSPVALVRKHLVNKSRAILRQTPRHHRRLSQEQLCAISDQLQ